MNNEVGKAFREVFITLLEKMGTDCEAGGETRKALISEDKFSGVMTFKFSDEFALKVGDKIRNCVTEAGFTVQSMRSISRGNMLNHFEVKASQ